MAAVAQRLVVLSVDKSPFPAGQGAGNGKVPRFTALPQISFAGAGPPLQVDAQVPDAQLTQEIRAVQPP